MLHRTTGTIPTGDRMMQVIRNSVKCGAYVDQVSAFEPISRQGTAMGVLGVSQFLYISLQFSFRTSHLLAFDRRLVTNVAGHT